MSNNFRKEQRYVVLKIKDIEAANLSESLQLALEEICIEVSVARIKRDKDMLECVVVESDWHCYGKVWEMVEAEYNAGADSQDRRV